MVIRRRAVFGKPILVDRLCFGLCYGDIVVWRLRMITKRRLLFGL